jgi:23S rRNA pseudouridine1911/1915/1917 synthase
MALQKKVGVMMNKYGNDLEWRIPRGEAERSAAEVLNATFPAASKTLPAWADELFGAGRVRRGGEALRPGDTVAGGDRLQVELFEEDEYGVPPEPLALDVLYEDDHLIVVNKAAGMKVHPNDPSERDTMLNALAFHYQMQGLQIRVRQLHRLDQETSGAIAFPKHAVAQKLLDKMLAERTLSRVYHALVHGKVHQTHGIIDSPIGRDRYHPTRRRVSPTGQTAKTEYHVLERFRDVTLVEAKLQTGRTHQIRVHFAHLGHPLLGDELYGGKTERIGRQALHARFLRFPHPLTGEGLDVEAPLPPDLLAVLEGLSRS